MHHRELRQVVDTKQPIKGVVPFTGGSGISGVYEYIFSPGLGPDGRVEMVLGTTRDVTERTNLLAALKSEREKLVEIFERAPAFMNVHRGPDLVFELANARYLEIVGRGRDIIGKPIEVLIRPATDPNRLRGVFESEGSTIGRLTRADVRIVDAAPAGAAAHAVISGGTEIIIPLAGLIDIDKECARLRGEVTELEKQIASREGRLNNPKYVERAPEQVVANDRAMLNEMKAKREQLVDKVRSLCGA